MEIKSILDNKILGSAGAFVLTLVFILLEHFNGGVITHHLLAREDLPGISNWWGLVTIPLLTWVVMSLINVRRDKTPEPTNLGDDTKILKHFLTALLFGIVASILWEFRLADILQYFILLPILIAFFKPVHLPEFLLGFVIGMSYTFGGILPIIVGTVLVVICFLVNKLVGAVKNIFIKN